MTFQELLKVPTGTIVETWNDGEIKCQIMRAHASLTAYFGIPLGSCIDGVPYDDIRLNVHGGLTFAREGQVDSGWEAGYYWIGWDYAHAGDAMFFEYDNSIPGIKQFQRAGDYKWGTEEVKASMLDALPELKKILIHKPISQALRKFLRMFL